MNRGTIILIAVLLVIIVAVLFVSNQQTSAPGITPTVAVSTGPLLPGIDGSKVVRYEIRDNTSGDFTALVKDTGGAWHIDGTNTLPGRDPDQNTINTTVGQIATVQYTNSFQDTQLSTFGLDKPSYTIQVTTSDNKLYSVYIGSKSPTSPSYYAVVVQGAAPPGTAEATVNAVAPTALPTILPTTVPTTAQATAEATAAATTVGKLLFQSDVRQAATAEATSAATAPAVAPTVVQPAAPATAESTSQPTVAVTELGTAEGTAEVTEFPTANVVQNPGITLTGTQTIYVVPQTVIDTLSGWLAQPPYAPLPTPTPTEAVTAEATVPPATAAVTAQPTVATTQATAATAQATAESTAAATTAP